MRPYRLIISLLLLFFTVPTFAYIDPGTGSMWLQTIIALAAGFGVTLKFYWQRFKNFLFRSKSKPAIKGEIKEEELQS